eukprot:Awhi_evm1s9936
MNALVLIQDSKNAKVVFSIFQIIGKETPIILTVVWMVADVAFKNFCMKMNLGIRSLCVQQQ